MGSVRSSVWALEFDLIHLAKDTSAKFVIIKTIVRILKVMILFRYLYIYTYIHIQRSLKSSRSIQEENDLLIDSSINYDRYEQTERKID